MENLTNNNISNLINELKESKARYKALSETAIEGIYITHNGYCIDTNLAGCKLLGYSRDEMLDKYALDAVHPDDKELALRMMFSKHEEPYNIRLVKKDGSLFEAEIRGKNYNYKDKGEARVIIIRDITEHNKVLNCLKESENKYRNLVEHAGDGIIIGNLKGEMIEINQGFLNLSGYKKEDLLNKPINSIFTPNSLSEKPLRYDTINDGYSLIIEREILTKSGEIIPIEMNSKKPDNNYYLSIIRDLRERKKAQDELLKTNKELIIAKEKAEESDRLKSAFLANMSHEIRTPMNGIIGFAELLKAPNISPPTRNEYLNIILASGHQLLNIIDDILEISKIETGQVTLETAPFSIKELLEELKFFFKHLAERNNNDIKLNQEHLITDTILGDKSKTQQIITNLVSNALKFTQEGTVTISIETIDSGTLFCIKDNGIGIAPEYKEHIFERFTQVNNTNVKKQKGTGLGLSICKKLVEMMEGKIWLESEIGIGSSFYFTIPNKDIK